MSDNGGMDPLYAMVCPRCGVVTPAAHDCDPLLVEFHEPDAALALGCAASGHILASTGGCMKVWVVSGYDAFDGSQYVLAVFDSEEKTARYNDRFHSVEEFTVE